MATETITTLQTLLQLGWPGISTIICWLLWRRLCAVQDARMSDMKEILTNDMQDLRSRLTTIEAQLSARQTASALADIASKNTTPPN